MKKPADEGNGELRRLVPLDDEAAERLLAGRRLTDQGDLAELAPLLDDIRSLGHGPVPPPSPALTRILTMGAPEDAGPMYTAGSRGNETARRRRAAAKAPWVAVAAAAVVVAVAATLDVLPRPAQRMVATAVSVVTPFHLPGDAQHENSLEKKQAAEAGRAPRAAKTPPDGTRSDDRQPSTTRQTARGSTGGVLPPAPATPGPNGTQIQPRRTVPPTSAPASSAVSASPGNSPPGTRVPVTAAPVVTNPPSPPQPPGASRPDRRSATLTGASVVPGPGDSDGTGAASIELNAEKGELCLTLTLSAVAPPTSLHLHQGPQGQSGPVVLELPPPIEVGPPASVCVPVSSDLSRKLREEPAGYYLEVHTREFADGALRGQLSIEPARS